MGRDRDHSHKSDHKKSRRSSSESDTDSDDGKYKKSKKSKRISYEKELEKLKEDHRKRKELIKSTETAEERRLRRLAKKERKQKKYDRLMGVDDLGYSNTNNPFGDTKLTENFVWSKKNEKEGVKDVNSYEQLKRQREKQEELRVELEKVKKRRQDRENEKLARDEEMQLLQREKEAAMFSGWEKQEDEFHLHQARLRSSIRIRDGRAKPIDLLAAYINPEEDNLEIQMHEPYTSLVGLSIDDLEDLIEDIKIYITIDQKNNQEFWEDITFIVNDELEKLKKKRDNDISAARRDVINNAVQTDIQSVFKGKIHSQLLALEKQIKGKLRMGGSIDVGYWESLLQQLKAFMAKARLKERHQQFLKKKLNELKLESSETLIKKDRPEAVVESNKNKSKSQIEQDQNKQEEAIDNADTKEEKGDEENEETVDEKLEIQRLTEAELAEQAMMEYEELNYEPKLIPFNDIEEEKWLNPTEDQSKLGVSKKINGMKWVKDNHLKKQTYLREQVKAGSTVEEEMERENMFNTDVLRENEESFNTAIDISTKKYKWSDKYRPRKPRFFNRVHTGYEWNKYNQTHYDQDNPPPKIVQGYKFNLNIEKKEADTTFLVKPEDLRQRIGFIDVIRNSIFYPDLIDKTKTPEYTLTQCEDDPDFCILRFKAGPPYEDIAFKVVDREWECSNRHGFRCQFYNNIFQLYFHFKRYRYRR